MSPPTSPDFRDALARLPTGVTVVTALDTDGPKGATANAVTSLSLEPPLMLAALDRGSRTLASLQASRRFGINVLAAGQEDLAHRFSTKEEGAVKWDGVAWSERAGVPAIEGVVLWLACDLGDVHDGGDHQIVTGMVRELEARGGDPLVFHGGRYRGLG